MRISQFVELHKLILKELNILSNEHLIHLIKQQIKQTHKIYWSCYDWKHEGVKPIIPIIEDILCNYKRRKWLKNIIKLTKKNI